MLTLGKEYSAYCIYERIPYSLTNLQDADLRVDLSPAEEEEDGVDHVAVSATDSTVDTGQKLWQLPGGVPADGPTLRADVYDCANLADDWTWYGTFARYMVYANVRWPSLTTAGSVVWDSGDGDTPVAGEEVGDVDACLTDPELGRDQIYGQVFRAVHTLSVEGREIHAGDLHADIVVSEENHKTCTCLVPGPEDKTVAFGPKGLSVIYDYYYICNNAAIDDTEDCDETPGTLLSWKQVIKCNGEVVKTYYHSFVAEGAHQVWPKTPSGTAPGWKEWEFVPGF
ncbi:MAG: hypothetical protein JXR94_03725 [Candidatus Hydrogenedentes bacterium]|nr:hypothetical protein [Candidatus Hydrogenedentota bacterium]